jgi:hypothetical protein
LDPEVSPLSPSPPLPSPLRTFPARPRTSRPRPCAFATRRRLAPRPRPAPTPLRVCAPAAAHPRRPPRPSLPGGGSPRWPPQPRAPRPGGLEPLRLHAPVAPRPARLATPHPRALVVVPASPATRASGSLACPHAARVLPARAACYRARDCSCATFNFQFNPFFILF